MAAEITPEMRKAYIKALTKLGKFGEELIAKSGISEQLAGSINAVVEAETMTLTLSNPEYWAVYYHQGRGTVNRLMIWFQNPADDPRLKGLNSRHAVKRSDIRPLTSAEYYEGEKRNVYMYRENPDGGRFQYMIVAKTTTPRQGTPYMTLAKPLIRERGKQLMKEAGLKSVRQYLRGVTTKSGERTRIRVKFDL